MAHYWGGFAGAGVGSELGVLAAARGGVPDLDEGASGELWAYGVYGDVDVD